ncbi:MAG: hypothetical protein AB7F86_16300 [Bdellovibrionales bacterium]
MAFTWPSFGQNPCGSAAYRPVAGFCVGLEGSAQVRDISPLEKSVGSLSARFPQLMARVRQNGYRYIHVRGPKPGETGGAVLAETIRVQKLIVIYQDFFTVVQASEHLRALPFSVAEVSLLHELLHAYDENNAVFEKIYPWLGWKSLGRISKDRFKDPSTGLSNLWILGSELARLKNQLSPYLNTHGPWFVYLQARNQMKMYGYPSIYSVLGGPMETFAEMGAYIALDPEAGSYMPDQIVRWYKQYVLR